MHSLKDRRKAQEAQHCGLLGAWAPFTSHSASLWAFDSGQVVLTLTCVLSAVVAEMKQ